jgi:hypothetical protein
LAVILLSVILLLFNSVADYFVTGTADGSRLQEAVKIYFTCVSVGIVGSDIGNICLS